MECLKVNIGKMPTRILILKMAILICSFCTVVFQFLREMNTSKDFCLKIAKNVYFRAIYLPTSCTHISDEADRETERQSLSCSFAAAPNFSNGLHDNKPIVLSSASLIYYFLLLLLSPWLVIYHEWMNKTEIFNFAGTIYSLVIFHPFDLCHEKTWYIRTKSCLILRHSTMKKLWKSKPQKEHRIYNYRKKANNNHSLKCPKSFRVYFFGLVILILKSKHIANDFQIEICQFNFPHQIKWYIIIEREIWRVYWLRGSLRSSSLLISITLNWNAIRFFSVLHTEMKKFRAKKKEKKKKKKECKKNRKA